MINIKNLKELLQLCRYHEDCEGCEIETYCDRNLMFEDIVLEIIKDNRKEKLEKLLS